METIEQNIEKQDLNNFNEISEKICDEINEKVNMIYDEIIKSVLPSSLAKNVIKRLHLWADEKWRLVFKDIEINWF